MINMKSTRRELRYTIELDSPTLSAICRDKENTYQKWEGLEIIISYSITFKHFPLLHAPCEGKQVYVLLNTKYVM